MVVSDRRGSDYVAMPQLGICDDSAPDGVTNQGNKEGEWFWCDSRLQVS